MTSRVAITGMGIVTCYGIGTSATWGKILAGEPGIRPITLFDTTDYRVRRAGEFTDLPVAPWRRFRAARMDRASNLLHHALAGALGGLDMPATATVPVPPLVALGTTLGGMTSGERYHGMYLRKGPPLARPSLVVGHLAQAQVLQIMDEFSLPGVPHIFLNACTSSANAIGHAFRAVRRGRAQVALCGGYDALCVFGFTGFHSLQALTTDVCRPFDRNRDGLSIGEGAGILLLESWDRAQGRGARILGEIVGYGESTDAFHMTRPEPEGRMAALAIQAAMRDAGISAAEVDYVNAHGTGTPFNDRSETAALVAAMGERAHSIPVSSTKAMIGHLLGGAGAAEAILTALALREAWLPPNGNYQTPDPDCALRIVKQAERPTRMRYALSNSFGFGGANATLAFRSVRTDS
jgi:3-oxoacyl-[acyl-carrier-protein] synthase II